MVNLCGSVDFFVPNETSWFLQSQQFMIHSMHDQKIYLSENIVILITMLQCWQICHFCGKDFLMCQPLLDTSHKKLWQQMVTTKCHYKMSLQIVTTDCYNKSEHIGCISNGFIYFPHDILCMCI